MSKVFEAVDTAFDENRITLNESLSEDSSENEYVVEYNDGAVQRTQTGVSTESFEGTREDLMEFLNDTYVECTTDDEDELVSFDEWLSAYEEEYDPSGSTVVLKITENGEEIYKNSDYEGFMEELDDDEDECDDDEDECDDDEDECDDDEDECDESENLKEDEGDSVFTLKINTSNEAFEGEPEREVARILQNIAANLEYTDNKSILDSNGNTVGSYGFGFEGVTEGCKKDLKETASVDEQWAKIAEILGDKLNDDNHSGGLYYVDVPAEDVIRIANEAPNFLDPAAQWNSAPSQDDFISFLRDNSQFEAECYVINPAERSDPRVTITGIKAPAEDENKAAIEQFVAACQEENVDISAPDEFDVYDGKIRAWWD